MHWLLLNAITAMPFQRTTKTQPFADQKPAMAPQTPSPPRLIAHVPFLIQLSEILKRLSGQPSVSHKEAQMALSGAVWNSCA